MSVSTPGNLLHFKVPAQFRGVVIGCRDVSSKYKPPYSGQSWARAALVGPAAKAGSRLENIWLLKCTDGDRCAKQSPWKHMRFFYPAPFSEEWQGWDSGHTRAADFQRARRSGNFKILEMLIHFGSCFKDQTNGAPVSSCVFCQNSRDNICAHPGLKISCQRIQLLKWAKQNSCLIEIYLFNI